MSGSESIELAAHDRERICPLLAAPGLIRGDTLSLRLAGEKIKLRAPRQYLAKLFEWCQGDMTLAQIEAASVAQWGEPRFAQFVEDLLAAGILIDTSTLLQSAARAARTPNWMGRPADKAIWRAAIPRLPEPAQVATEAIQLPSSGASSFAGLLAQRRSADAFGTQPLPLQTLTGLLHAAYGMQASGHRSVASAGGFYGLRLHVVLLAPIGGIASGTYAVRFDTQGGVHLEREHDELDHIPSLVYHPHMLRHAAGLVIVSSDLAPSTLKYGNRSYPFALLEAGAIIQNLALAAAELHIGWRTLGGLDYPSVEQHCGLSQREHALIAGVFGALPDDALAVKGSAHEIEFLWSDAVAGLPFHLAMARIDSGGETAAQSFSWGRDASAWRAYDKAVAEAAERHAYRQPRPWRSETWQPGSDQCDPRALVAYSRAQYRRAGFPYKPFDRATPYLWTETRNVLTGATRWVPAECVLHRNALPAEYFETRLTAASSSGCASGTSVTMAQQSALFELIERDAFMRHWFAQRGGDEIDADTLPAGILARIGELQSRGCRVSVQVLDLAVHPVWMILVQHDAMHFTTVGASAGLDLERVLHSALSEAETAAYARLGGLKAEPIRPADVRTPAEHADLYAHKRYYKRADGLFVTQGRYAFEEVARRHAPDISTFYADLQARGFELLWVDLSLPDAPLTLTGERLVSGRMLVPGLIPIGFGAHDLPLGMAAGVHRGARFPHPFP
ncbi:YcaO-like family protein [Trinickia fusca]|uniref:YcaO domain-containing protein n=1 Tax=Trinickia fusca TaxID=2419777 RepID=A0A494XCC2_9BURK|nr:YcaO-like family protein [Trinickia fusca]RKP48405.1 hypothetical protein D7S89_13935 [Trinickia fusca]